MKRSFKFSYPVFSFLLIFCFYFQTKAQNSGKKTSVRIIAELSDPLLKENSGMIWYDGLAWFICDSGSNPEIYGFDTSVKKIVKILKIKNAPNHDWEDLAQDEQYIYVGDFGNNSGDRKNLCILKIQKFKFKAEENLQAEIIHFSYTDQTDFSKRNKEHNFDCEALFCMNNDLYIFTKNWTDYQTRLYKIPNQSGNYSVSPLKSLNINGLITGADYDKQSQTLALCGYKLKGIILSPFIIVFKNINASNIADINSFSKNSLNVDYHQVEAICITPDNQFLFSNEGLKKSSIQIAAKLMEFKFLN